MTLIKALARTDRIQIRQRLLHDVAWISAFVTVCDSAALIDVQGPGVDSHAYWLIWQPGHAMYNTGPMTHDAYLYSPVFAQLVWPIAQLPWPVFCAIFTVLPALAVAWLVAPLGRRWAIPIWLLALPEIVSGNIFAILGVVAAIGLRYPAAWSIAALTKVTPCLGPTWFAMRHEWRGLAKSLTATLLIACTSIAVSPHLWSQWIHFLIAHAGESSTTLGIGWLPGPLFRVPVAVLLVAWGARTNRRWTIPAAMVFAAPVLWFGSLTMLMALPHLNARGDNAVRPDLTSAPLKVRGFASTP